VWGSNGEHGDNPGYRGDRNKRWWQHRALIYQHPGTTNDKNSNQPRRHSNEQNYRVMKTRNESSENMTQLKRVWEGQKHTKITFKKEVKYGVSCRNDCYDAVKNIAA
jgi:hypothetical protein